MRIGKYLGVFLLCMLLMGCTGKSDSEVETAVTENQEETDYVAEYQSIEKRDLFNQQWNCKKPENSEQFMAYTDFIPEVFPKNESSTRYNRGYFADSQNIYSFDTYYHQGKDGLYYDTGYLNILDGVTKKVQTITYQAKEGVLGLMMLNPYRVGGRFFTANFGFDEDGNMNRLCVVELLMDGTICEMVDLCSVAAEKRMLPEPYYVPNIWLYYEPANDAFYMLSPVNDVMYMYLIDSEGNLLPDSEEMGNRIWLLAATEEGRLIFAKQESSNYTCFYYEDGKKKVLCCGEKGDFQIGDTATIDEHGRLLFTENASVVEWDVDSGSQERLYVDASGDMLSGMNIIDCVMRNANGEILILRNNNLRVLTQKGPTEQVTIQIKPFLYYDDNLKRAAKTYEMTHPGVTIKLLEASEWGNRDRDIIELVQDMAEGGGADLLLLDREEMLSFDKNECLLDLSQVLVPTTREKLISGVLEYGRTDHGVMLLSYEPRLNTAFVNKKYLQGTSWTVQDIVGIIEKREREGNPFSMLVRGAYHPFAIFNTAIFDSGFVDFEAGTCCFDSDLFVKVLEICKRYNKEYDYSEDSLRMLKNDEILMLTDVSSIRNYAITCATVGEDFVTAGYPSASGNGNHVDYGAGFAINKNTKYYDVIADFINWYFSLENTSLIYQVPIRMDLYEGRVVVPESDNLTEEPYIKIDDNSRWPLPGKPDGSSYAEEYLELVEQSQYDVNTVMGNNITAILWEEAEPYFEGNGKSASEVAKIIQSRVSLYLQENR